MNILVNGSRIIKHVHLMKLTRKRKLFIDALNYSRLLNQLKYAPARDPWLEGETGRYWYNKMKQYRNRTPRHLSLSYITSILPNKEKPRLKWENILPKFS